MRAYKNEVHSNCIGYALYQLGLLEDITDKEVFVDCDPLEDYPLKVVNTRESNIYLALQNPEILAETDAIGVLMEIYEKERLGHLVVVDKENPHLVHYRDGHGGKVEENVPVFTALRRYLGETLYEVVLLKVED